MKPNIKSKNPNWIKDLEKKFREAADQEVAVGFPKGKVGSYPDGTSILKVAIENVYGGEHTQPRNFMAAASPGIEANTKEIMKNVAKLANAPAVSNAPAQINSLLMAAGIAAADQIKRAIVDGTYTPNSDLPMSGALRSSVEESWGVSIPPGMSYKDAKKKFKGSDKPLIVDGTMKDAVTYVVRKRTRR